jgi:MscS family membrane protein
VLSFGAALIFWAILRAMQPLSRHLGTLEGKLTRPMIAWITKGLRALIFFVAVAAILNIWGIQVGPILAGLGLLGAAVALGAQDLFKNLIAGLMLLSEKRFDIGDWILVEGVVEGDVERIGFRSTLIRRFDKAPVYVPNTKLSDDAVINFSRMTYRRLMWTIGLEFRATQEQIDDVCARIRAYIDSNPDFVTPDKANIFVGMDKFSENAVDIQLLCFTHKIRWADFVQVKESLARAVKKIVTDSGTSFAYPSRSVYVESAPADVDPKVLAAAGAG